MTLTDLETYFATAELPKEIRLNRFSYLTDVQLFVNYHISVLKAHPKNSRFMPYYLRLMELYRVLSKK
jgi:hypothetical protein